MLYGMRHLIWLEFLKVVVKNGDSAPLPNPDNYRDWFLYHDKIDLRRHLQDIEIVLTEAALEKSAGS